VRSTHTYDVNSSAVGRSLLPCIHWGRVGFPTFLTSTSLPYSIECRKADQKSFGCGRMFAS